MNSTRLVRFMSAGGRGRPPICASQGRRTSGAMRKHSMILTGGLAVAAATFLPFGLAPPALAAHAPRYVITDLGTLGGSFSGGASVNNRGDVTGLSLTPGDAAVRGFLWRDGHLRDVGTLGGPQSAAGEINESGQFSGWSNTADPAPPSIFNQDSVFCTPPVAGEPAFACHAFLSSHGSMIDLGTLGGVNSAAMNQGINDAGDVVGVAETSTVDPTTGGLIFHAFVWRRGRMIDLGTEGGASYSDANAINNRGQVAAVSFTGTTTAPASIAYVWRNGHTTPLGSLGGSWTIPLQINDRGQVVGHSTTPDATTHAFLWQRGHMTDLGTLPGDVNSEAGDISNDGTVVGQSCSTDFAQCRATVWSHGTVIDLNQTLSPAAGGQLISAGGINARGQITGFGIVDGEFHAFLLTPSH
jgi:probable HAF family extracellular repeat protein